MAEALGVAASIIAVIQISGTIVSLCKKYYKDARDGRENIELLRAKVEYIQAILEDLQGLYKNTNYSAIKDYEKLERSLAGCRKRLEQIEEKLENKLDERASKMRGRLKIKYLKWPFEPSEDKEIIAKIDSYETTFILNLNIGHARSLAKLTEKFDLSRLPTASGALYDSLEEESKAVCLEHTRVELLAQIDSWAEGKDGRSIFWLNGMAGTGKSTIARTVAQQLSKKGKPVATFFFNRNEDTRNTAARLFPTIAVQLSESLPEIGPEIAKALEKDPHVADKALNIQFEKLVLNPLLNTNKQSLHESIHVIIIDALDECKNEDHIKAVLYHLSRTKELRPISLRLLITSRPDLPIRLGFKKMATKLYKREELHLVPREQIERDIKLFMGKEFSKIREERDLPGFWPNGEDIQSLVDKAIPLFIFAATACRFVADAPDPMDQLKEYLTYQIQGGKYGVENIYMPVLERLIDGKDKEKADRELKSFQNIVGTIVLLQTPLTLKSLSRLLGTEEDGVRCRLDRLHSVLHVPEDRTVPIRTLHLSFRDFLLSSSHDDDERVKRFKVDEKQRHYTIAIQCIELLSKPGCLRENICDLPSPGTLRSDVDKMMVDRRLPPHLQYACRYWVYHLEQSSRNINDGDPAHEFLKQHLLHWIEALSLMGDLSESVHMVNSLLLIAKTDRGTELADFINDIRRFALTNRWIIDNAPLQIYSSTLVFAPKRSLVKKVFASKIPDWIRVITGVHETWSATLQTLEGHTDWVYEVAYSPQGNILASTGNDKTVGIWDAASGAQIQIFEEDEELRSLAFSPDSRYIAAGDDAGRIALWDVITGAKVQTWKAHRRSVRYVEFSPDLQRRLLLSASEDEMVLWEWECNAVVEAEPQILARFSDCGDVAAFSPDGAQLISKLFKRDSVVKVWNVRTGREQQFELESEIYSVAFSADGHLLASGMRDGRVVLCNAITGEQEVEIRGHTDPVSSVAFSPDGACVASASGDRTVRLWAADTGQPLQRFTGHTRWVRSVAFSPDGTQLASASEDGTVRLWDAAAHTDTEASSSPYSSNVNIRIAVISPDGTRFVSGRWDGTLIVWGTSTGLRLAVCRGHQVWVRHVTFSPDGRHLASVSDDKTVRIWDTSTGQQLHAVNYHTYCQRIIPISSTTGHWILYFTDGIRMWDTTNIEHLNTTDTSPLPQPSPIQACDGEQKGIKSTSSMAESADQELFDG